MLFRLFAPLRFIGGLLVAFLALGSVSLHAQALPKQDEMLVDHEPVYVTVRVFQARAKKDAYDLSDQMFKLPTAKLTCYENWVTGLTKAYPDFKIELLQTTPLTVVKSPKPGIVAFGDRNKRSFEFHVLAANGINGGTEPGTSIILEAEYHYGNDQIRKPVSLAIKPFDAEEGMTYFFTNKNMGLEAGDYVNFMRPGAAAKAFEDEHIFFIFVASVSFKKPVETLRVLDSKQSADLQAGATKKVEPTLPEEVCQLGLKGSIQVSVEIGPDGRVTSADVVKSSLPEANDATIAAARQWEFPASVLGESKTPVKGRLTFNLTPPPKPASPTSK